MAGSDPSRRPRHVSGLWRGEAVPAASLADSVPANPITWSLTLLHPSSVSAFGAGYMDDCGDVPGEPVLMYTLRGEWQPGDAGGSGAGAGGASSDGGAVSFVKEYTSPALFGVGPSVRYDGRLSRHSDGAWALTGTWRNEAEGTHGVFAARREEPSEPEAAAAGAAYGVLAC